MTFFRSFAKNCIMFMTVMRMYYFTINHNGKSRTDQYYLQPIGLHFKLLNYKCFVRKVMDILTVVYTRI